MNTKRKLHLIDKLEYIDPFYLIEEESKWFQNLWNYDWFKGYLKSKTNWIKPRLDKEEIEGLKKLIKRKLVIELNENLTKEEQEEKEQLEKKEQLLKRIGLTEEEFIFLKNKIKNKKYEKD